MTTTDTTPTVCEKCSQPHSGCAAHNRSGNPCGRRPMKGQRVCPMHGGKATRARNNGIAKHALQVERARAGMAMTKVDIHPVIALLDAVQWTAGEVDYWRARVQQLDDEQLTWSTTTHREGVGPLGVVDERTHEATRHVAYTQYVEAQERLVRFSTAALKAGVEERRVRLAEAQGEAVAGVLRAVLDELDLTDEQKAVAARVIPERLRALGAS